MFQHITAIKPTSRWHYHVLLKSFPDEFFQNNVADEKNVLFVMARSIIIAAGSCLVVEFQKVKPTLCPRHHRFSQVYQRSFGFPCPDGNQRWTVSAFCADVFRKMFGNRFELRTKTLHNIFFANCNFLQNLATKPSIYQLYQCFSNYSNANLVCHVRVRQRTPPKRFFPSQKRVVRDELSTVTIVTKCKFVELQP